LDQTGGYSELRRPRAEEGSNSWEMTAVDFVKGTAATTGERKKGMVQSSKKMNLKPCTDGGWGFEDSSRRTRRNSTQKGKGGKEEYMKAGCYTIPTKESSLQMGDGD